MNTNSERGFTAHAHVHRIITDFNHWPSEALETNHLKLPTLRILRLAGTLPGFEFENLSSLHQDTDIATYIRSASQTIDQTRQENISTLQGQPGTKEYDKLVRQNCKPLLYSNKLLKHLAPQWETNTCTWHKLITSHHTDSTDASYHISPTDVILAKLPNGLKPGSKTELRTTIDTLKATLLLPATTEHRKLPKLNTTNITLIHHTWYTYLNTRGLPAHTPINFETLIKRSSNNRTTLK
jgi:hypothetical protein